MKKRLSKKLILLMTILFFVSNLFIISFKSHLSYADAETIPSTTREQFIKKVTPTIQEVAQAYGIRPSVVLGQAILSSKNGSTYLARNYHNLFDLQANKGEPSIELLVKDYDGETEKDKPVRFKTYQSWEDSVRDYMLIIQEEQIWGKNAYSALVNAKDYKAAALILEEIGFSNDPEYATKLINLIDEEDLTRYDFD